MNELIIIVLVAVNKLRSLFLRFILSFSGDILASRVHSRLISGTFYAAEKYSVIKNKLKSRLVARSSFSGIVNFFYNNRFVGLFRSLVKVQSLFLSLKSTMMMIRSSPSPAIGA